MSARPPGFDRFSMRLPEGDTHKRLVCDDCGWIHYVNPKVVVGAVCSWQGRLLLCRRAIEPRSGYWTMPSGYLEERETTEQGAAREAREEAEADIEIEALLAVYNIPRISQVQIIYKARLRTADVAPGAESAEVRFFDWDEVPWDGLAFPTVRWALDHYRTVEHQTVFAAFTNPSDETGDMRARHKPR
jgi:ADP-ribose pyrophosphatase YjhB (NUDIX family)